MKTTLVTWILTALMTAPMGFASSKEVSFDCVSDDGQSIATLSLASQAQALQWSDLTQSAGSVGYYLGVERAPFSSTHEFLKYRLDDFYKSGDSQFILALEPRAITGASSFQVVIYFDHDDHEEDESIYHCVELR